MRQITDELKVAAGIFALLLSGCSKDQSCAYSHSESTNSDWATIQNIFDPDRLLEVELTLSCRDWDEIRHQVRNEGSAYGSNCDQPPSNPFKYVPADISIDGVRIPNVGLRKKGWYSSTETGKPSLKVRFDKYVDGIKVDGYEQLTLNNCMADPSLIRQCLAFGVLEAAGLPVPKYNFAHVRVNGKDLGIYAHIEGAKEKFLQRHFSDVQGDFFEGTECDFRFGNGWIQRFSRQTNENVPGYGRIPALATALESTDQDLLNALDPLVDLDRFMTFWAAEVLVGHADGYAASAANFYIYDDPTTGKFQFIPWDVDYTFDSEIDAASGVRSVYANAQLAKRLYLLPATRAQYLARLDSLLNTVWIESQLIASIDSMESLLDLHLTPANRSEIAKVRQYVLSLRARIVPELTSGAVQTPDVLQSPCGS